ncbi:MAG: type pilus secretin PilQ [Francisellaceae bacterium]|nr:type pilus secretin PilQ [Francisellaceae bacterium]
MDGKFVIKKLVLGLIGLVLSQSILAAPNLPKAILEDIIVNSLPGDQAEIHLKMSQPVLLPKEFSQNTPPQFVWDFTNVDTKLSTAKLTQKIENGILKTIKVINTPDKLRLIAEVNEIVPFQTSVVGNEVIIKMAPHLVVSSTQNSTSVAKVIDDSAIESIDFRRGEQGEARLIINLSNASTGIDFKEEGTKIVARFLDTTIPARLINKYDVSDFGTPVKSMISSQLTKEAKIEIEATGNFDKMAYQMDKQFVIEVRPLSKAEQETYQKSKFQYTGERLSLNFQDIEVRAVLELLADFTGLNIVTSDTVKGNVTLRLQNVPWDQALDMIMQSKGLAKRENGNVIVIGPSEEIAAREKQDLETSQKVVELAPLKSEFIKINYAKASDIASFLKDKTNSILSSRGNVTVDTRTNTLLLQDVGSKINEVRELLKNLDSAVPQVEIDTRIVTVNDRAQDSFGLKFGGAAKANIGRKILGIGSTLPRARTIASQAGDVSFTPTPTTEAQTMPWDGTADVSPSISNIDGLFTDFSTTNAIGKLAKVGLAVANLPRGTLIDLELQALEAESLARVVARPKLRTLDQTKASVEQGVQIPYTESSSSGAGTISFVTAALKVEVTPHITPDDNISLDLQINNDAQGDPVQVSGGSQPAINTNRLTTQVLVGNGETVVLGGIIKETTSKSRQRVPFFGSIPVLGNLFKNKSKDTTTNELLIFITPRILKDLGLNEQN